MKSSQMSPKKFLKARFKGTVAGVITLQTICLTMAPHLVSAANGPALSDVACAALAKHGIKSEACPPKNPGNNSSSVPSADSSKPPQGFGAGHSTQHPVNSEIEDTKETEATDTPDAINEAPTAESSLQSLDLDPDLNDLGPGEYGPENIGGISFGFMHTRQGCKVQEGSFLHKETYCNKEDQKQAQEKSGMVKAINEMLDTVKSKASTAKVNIAYFSFSNVGVQMKLCELSQAGVPIRVFLDGGSAGQIDQNIMNNPACRDSHGNLNVKLSYLGGQTNGGAGGIWRLHHNKFMMIDPGDGSDVKVNFSSGNLSSFGTSLHLDHWVTTEAPRKSNLVKAQYCVMAGLEAAASTSQMNSFTDAKAKDKAIAKAYLDTRENCFDNNKVIPRMSGGNLQSQIDKVLKLEQIAPLFSPNSDMAVEKSLIAAIGKIPQGGYLYIAIQHFLHREVGDALIEASARGVDVRVIMDDDALRGESEVPGVDQMIRKLVKSSGGKIQVRLAETNHSAGGNGAMMHNKLAILNGSITFSGAGHYTNAAMRNNWENFYFVTNMGIVASYAKYFSYLWSQSVDIAYTESKGAVPSTAPSPLKAGFIELAQ